MTWRQLALWVSWNESHRLTCIQVEGKQILNKLGFPGSLLLTAVMVLHLRAPGPITSVEERGKKSIKYQCFVNIPVCEVTIHEPMFTLVLLLLLTYFKSPFYYPWQYWLASTLIKFWLHKFSPFKGSSISVLLPYSLTLLPVAILFPLVVLHPPMYVTANRLLIII